MFVPSVVEVVVAAVGVENRHVLRGQVPADSPPGGLRGDRIRLDPPVAARGAGPAQADEVGGLVDPRDVPGPTHAACDPVLRGEGSSPTAPDALVLVAFPDQGDDREHRPGVHAFPHRWSHNR
jgi:hypothetical protein